MLETLIIEPKTPATHAIIWLHGLGADAHDFEPIMPQLQPDNGTAMRFILPHAPVRAVSLFGGMPARAWFDLSANHKEKSYSVETVEIVAMATRIEQLIDAQIAQGIPSKNIILAGFSQGGAMAVYTALCSSKALGGVIGLSTFLPMVNQLTAQTTHRFPVFIGHGITDEVIPYATGVTLATDLKQAGFSVTWKSYSIAHSVSPAEIQDILSWLNSNTET